MIDRISSASPMAALTLTAGGDASPARLGSRAVIDALTLADPVGTPLRAIASGASAVIAELAGRTDPVGLAQIDRGVLDFAREAKSFAIGHADRGGDAVRATLDDALTQGELAADRRASGHFDAGDHAVFALAHAAAHLQTQ